MQAGAEILIDGPMVRRGARMMDALAAAAPSGSLVTASYGGRHRLLVMYGAGRPDRLQVMHRHLRAGGRVAAWDLAYWDRDASMRVSIDGLHPSAQQLEAAPACGDRGAPALREDADPDGPVLLVGVGKKSALAAGLEPMRWEREALVGIQAAHPDRVVRWRPKGKKAVSLEGAVLWHGMPIEVALRGCSLVVCRTSNVAVDACIAGVPVQCEGGAAHVLYAAGSAPAPAARAEFLRRLGWFNWRPSEAAAAWRWMEGLTQC